MGVGYFGENGCKKGIVLIVCRIRVSIFNLVYMYKIV